jgi:hypothetical protein
MILSLFVLAYPPPDPKIRAWFAEEIRSQSALQDRCNAFLHALLGHTCKVLTDISNDLSATLQGQGPQQRLHSLSSEFRNKMAEGGDFENHGPYRSAFYDDAMKQANSVSWQSFFYP